jgi:hypothetical protein
MVWQDWILTIGQILFIFALAPSVFSKDKPALTTSLLTGTVLAVFAIVFATLYLWLAATSTLVSSLTWLLLAYQKYSINNSNRRDKASMK